MPHILNSEQVFAVDAHAPPAVMPGLRHSVVLKDWKGSWKKKKNQEPLNPSPGFHKPRKTENYDEYTSSLKPMNMDTCPLTLMSDKQNWQHEFILTWEPKKASRDWLSDSGAG